MLNTLSSMLAFSLLFSAGPARAQQTIAGKVTKGFSVIPEFFEPPHERQMKSKLEGSEVQQQPDGRLLVKGVKLQTFREDGERELLVEAPQCLYDPSEHSVSSSEELRIAAAAGGFSIEGQGFVWQQTNSSIFISNRVHTFVQPNLLEGRGGLARTNASPLPGEGIQILSERFDYFAATGLGTYRENVRVSGTNLTLASAVLSVLLPITNRAVQTITADRNVVLNYEAGQAEGEHAVYSVESGAVEISGQPRWQAEQSEGRGDILTIDRMNKAFRADGHAWLKMPARRKDSAGFLPIREAASTNSLAATNQFVEIESAAYEVQTNAAVFRDQVRVSERVEDEVQGTMSCNMLDARFSPAKEMEQMTAEGSVVIEKGGERLEAGRAVYTATDGLLNLENHPSWRAGLREGNGDSISILVPRNEMEVRGHATMRLPAGELSGLSQAHTGASGELPRREGAGSPFARITSSEYRFTEGSAHFSGGVAIDHPQMAWSCENLAVEFSPQGGTVHTIVADQRLVFDLSDNQGQQIHGTGDRAFYAVSSSGGKTNEVVTLTGEPAVLERTNAVVRNSVIILDRSNNKLSAPGKYEVSAWIGGAASNAANGSGTR